MFFPGKSSTSRFGFPVVTHTHTRIRSVAQLDLWATWHVVSRLCRRAPWTFDHPKCLESKVGVPETLSQVTRPDSTEVSLNAPGVDSPFFSTIVLSTYRPFSPRFSEVFWKKGLERMEMEGTQHVCGTPVKQTIPGVMVARTQSPLKEGTPRTAPLTTPAKLAP